MDASVIEVVAAVAVREGRHLVCQRPAHKRHGGLWEFPGGKLEPGETLQEAVRRELAEELGVEGTEAGPCLATFHDPGSPYRVAFHPVTFRGEPRCLEHAALAWATPAELAALPLAPSDRRFVETVLLAGA